MSRSRPTTPLRRISRGSLSALSGATSENQTPLSFLDGAIADLADDAAVLHSNLEQINSIHQALGTFNESFSMLMYGLKMNAFCVEWPDAPNEDNFQRAEERAARAPQPQFYQGSGPSQARQSYGNNSGYGDDFNHDNNGGGGHVGDQTYVTQDDEDEILPPKKSALKPALKKPSTIPKSKSTTTATTAGSSAPAKGKITLATKKKREVMASQIIETLPLEYRGADASVRSLAESVILALMAGGNKGARIADIVKPPELTQAKVNKALIALVKAKHVTKTSNNGIVYQLDPSRHPTIP